MPIYRVQQLWYGVLSIDEGYFHELRSSFDFGSDCVSCLICLAWFARTGKVCHQSCPVRNCVGSWLDDEEDSDRSASKTGMQFSSPTTSFVLAHYWPRVLALSSSSTHSKAVAGRHGYRNRLLNWAVSQPFLYRFRQVYVTGSSVHYHRGTEASLLRRRLPEIKLWVSTAS